MAAFTIFVTWLGGLSFALLAVVLSLFILLEYGNIVAATFVARIIGFAFWALIVTAWIAVDPQTALVLFVIGVVALFFFELVNRRSIWMAVGLCYAILPFIALVTLRGNSTDGFHMVLIMFLGVWATDSFGYLVGKPVGGPKLAVSISPNKTWSGFFGGIAGAMLLMWLTALGLGYQPALPLAIFAVAVAVVSQIGDLMESALKRKFQIKDSGTIIPGHGGVLDRIDGLVVAAVFVCAFVMISEKTWLGAFTNSYNIASPLLQTILPPLSGG